MKPESARFVDQAGIMLGRAEVMLNVSLNEEAARAAYMACFHVAQTYIYERMSKVFKSHKGVQTEFLRLSRDEQETDPELARFLAKSYDFKSVADYFAGAKVTISTEEATSAIISAKQFVRHFTKLTPIAGSSPP